MEGLIAAYTELVALGEVRSLLRAVNQDPQNETVNFRASLLPVLETYKGLADDNTRTRARAGIIGFLNRVMYVTYGVKIDPASGLAIWLWENHTRLTKFLVVSIILEGYNLRSFGVTKVERNDIPQALIRVKLVIDQCRANVFEQVKKNYEAETAKVEEKEPEFVRLYLEQ